MAPRPWPTPASTSHPRTVRRRGRAAAHRAGPDQGNHAVKGDAGRLEMRHLARFERQPEEVGRAVGRSAAPTVIVTGRVERPRGRDRRRDQRESAAHSRTAAVARGPGDSASVSIGPSSSRADGSHRVNTWIHSRRRAISRDQATGASGVGSRLRGSGPAEPPSASTSSASALTSCCPPTSSRRTSRRYVGCAV